MRRAAMAFGLVGLVATGAWVFQAWRASEPVMWDGWPVSFASLALMPDAFSEGHWEYWPEYKHHPELPHNYVWRRRPLTAFARLRGWMEEHLQPIILGY